MEKIVKRILPGLLLLTLAVPAHAENRSGAFTISPFVGGYLLDHKQLEENRPLFGVRGGYNFTKNIGAEAMFGYSLTSKKDRYGSKETDIYRYGVDILYHFMPDNNFVPFFAIGGGGTSFNTPDTANTGYNKDHYAGLFNYGGGFKYFVSDNVALRGDVRHIVLVHDTGDHNLEYTAGLTFQFGGVQKTMAVLPPPAAVAVAEKRAEAIVTPAPADTTAPTVTLTAPVSDSTTAPLGQNIRAAFSEPMDPASITEETFSLAQDSTPVQGTVSYDNSVATFTPSSKLEKGKLYTAIISTKAKDVAGNSIANNYLWKFKAISAPVVVKSLATLENSHFLFDRSDINENGKTILNHNVVILKGDKALKIRVSGYTSAAGSEEYNQKLSERRAQSVKDYLVKSGIDENRITTIGYGKSNPAKHEVDPSDKFSDAAHANMRVIVDVIEE